MVEPRISLFKFAYPTDDDANDFIEENAHNPNVELSFGMRTAIRTLIVKYANTLIDSSFSNSNLPENWSDSQLILHARHIRDYQGLLICCKDNINDDYMQFIENNNYISHIKKSIADGNLFIAYFHVVKLFREITSLNNLANQEIDKSQHINKLVNCYEELGVTIDSLTIIQNEENRFWTIALLALSIHATASINYNFNNDNFYNLERSMQLLELVIKLCDEGEKVLAKTDKTIIDFYTLKQSLLPTLPYESFTQEKEEILKLDIWSLRAKP